MMTTYQKIENPYIKPEEVHRRRHFGGAMQITFLFMNFKI